MVGSFVLYVNHSSHIYDNKTNAYEKGYKEESIMTRSEFLSMDWSDSQIGYDMQVGVPDGDSRTIAYLTLSKKYPNSLCLVTTS